jgi:large subunit ribosomal protein L35
MPKMKTNKSVAKRFKLTGKGKVKRRQANKSHISA